MVVLLFFPVYTYSMKHLMLKQDTCADFKTYVQAKQAYDEGEKYLDRNGDGIPCNSLYKINEQ